MAEHKGFPTCRHIKTDGEQCGSPALSGRHFCDHHTLWLSLQSWQPPATLSGTGTYTEVPWKEELSLGAPG